MKNSYSLSDLKAFYSEDRAIRSKDNKELAIAEKFFRQNLEGKQKIS
jgi:hypothetical protein